MVVSTQTRILASMLALVVAGGCAGTSSAQRVSSGTTDPDTSVYSYQGAGSGDGVTTCVQPYSVRSPQGTIRVGSCGGLSSAMAASVSLRPGQTLSIASMLDGDGSGGTMPVFDIPTSDQPAVIQVVQSDPSRGTATFQAEGVGEATLSTVSMYCQDTPGATAPIPTATECPVLRISVTQ